MGGGFSGQNSASKDLLVLQSLNLLLIHPQPVLQHSRGVLTQAGWR
jgi:hypothetical protein